MGNDRAAKDPRMKFRRIGGFYQLNVTDLQDLRYALELDEAHWALNSIDLDSMYTDRQFLNFVDDDHNGMIRVDEVKRAIRWYLDRIKPDSDPGAGTDVLHLDAINSGRSNSVRSSPGGAGKSRYAGRFLTHPLPDPQ